MRKNCSRVYTKAREMATASTPAHPLLVIFASTTTK